MKIVLRADVEGVGLKGDVLDVSDGYARNHLIPRGLALRATAGTERQASSMRKSGELSDAVDRTSAEEIAARLVDLTVVISARASESGTLFGSVAPSDVAHAVEEQSGVLIDRKALISNEPVKELGTHVFTAKVHKEVEFPIRVEVIESE